MKVIFTNKHMSIASRLIKLVTLSKFSHMAVLLKDGNVIDTTFLSGVRIQSLEKFSKHYRDRIVREVVLPNELAAEQFLYSQIGKSYDWTALVGIAVRNGKWTDDDKWFCSELVEAAIKIGGLDRFVEKLSRIIPQYCWAIK